MFCRKSEHGHGVEGRKGNVDRLTDSTIIPHNHIFIFTIWFFLLTNFSSCLYFQIPWVGKHYVSMKYTIKMYVTYILSSTLILVVFWSCPIFPLHNSQSAQCSVWLVLTRQLFKIIRNPQTLDFVTTKILKPSLHLLKDTKIKLCEELKYQADNQVFGLF